MSGELIASRRGRRRRAVARPMAEINVTPFVDVMMVLLVVFMVAAPLLTVGVPLQLPRSSASPLPVVREEPLTINVDASGQVYIQKTPTPFEELIPRLRAIAAERTDDRVFLRADAALDYGRVAQVMGALNAGGFRSIGLVTDPAASGADRR
ncbi:MAG: ExbD/TolR family protein [Rubrimonas sp.]|uniref:ExbD/TolR family protein n=1 Tax=Rubrimonas sp. TaxID=2036015 RepID=UPI002FDE6778